MSSNSLSVPKLEWCVCVGRENGMSQGTQPSLTDLTHSVPPPSPPPGTVGVITHAFHLKKQFYPAVVYLNGSGVCMMVRGHPNVSPFCCALVVF